MRKTMQLILYPLLAILVVLFVREAVAQTATKPLVVLRFNQPNVYYEQPLYQAIEKAVAVKPTVMFDIVSLAPATGNAQYDAAWQQAASANTQKVVASLQNMGVPLSRMNIRGQQQAGLTADEVQLYVR